MQEYEILQAIYLLKKIRKTYIEKHPWRDEDVLKNIDNTISDIRFIQARIEDNTI